MRKRDRPRNFKVGLVVVSSSALFLGMVLFILGSSLNSNLVKYYILFEESVKGMVTGSKVTFQGIPVGAVSDIRFERGKTQVEISVDPEKAEIQDVTVAHMNRLMITGQVTVELEGYRSDGAALPEGGMIPPELSLFDEFTQSLPEVVSDADDVLLSLRELINRVTGLLDEDTRTALKMTATNLQRASAALGDGLGPLLAELRATVAELRPALKTIESSFDKVSALAEGEAVVGALRSVQEAMTHVDHIEAEILHLVRDLRGTIGGSRRSWMGALLTARDALNEIRMLARNLRMAPSSLVFGRQNHEIQIPATPVGGRK